MKLMSITKKKVVALGLAGGLALGMGGIAAAFLTTSGSGTGTAAVTGATPLHFDLVTNTFKVNAPTKVVFTITNPNNFVVHLTTTPAHITSVTQTSAANTCAPATTKGATLLTATVVTVTSATAVIGTVAATAPAATTTTAQRPTLTLNTEAVAQNTCTFKITIAAS